MLASYVVLLASRQTNDPSGSLVAVAEGLLVEVLLANTKSVLETTRVAHNQRNRNQPIDFDYYKITPSDYD